MTRNGNGQLQVQLPAFDPVLQIKAPAGTTRFQIQIAVAAMQINDRPGQDFFKTDWLLDYKPVLVNVTNINLPIDTAAGRLIVVAISLQYFANNNNIINQLIWKLAGIVGSFYN